MAKKTEFLFDEDKAGGAVATSEDFGALFNASKGTGKVKVGQTIQGEILSIGKEESFVSTGTPVDGMIPSMDLRGPDGVLKYKVGEFISVKVIGLKGGEIRLRKEGGVTSSEGDDTSLEDAFDMELPVSGKVLESVKGGFRVRVGAVNAFCPLSQMGLRPSEDPNSVVGRNFDFRVIEFANDGRKVVVSRRKILEAQRLEHENVFIDSVKVGDPLTVTITRIEKYGAFAETADGVVGLIPISEMAWGRVENPNDILKIGQECQVTLLKAEEEGDRLKVSFSIKQGGGSSDPWLAVLQKYSVGQRVDGLVTKKETYGLFVQLEPGITGLLPRAKWRDLPDGKDFEGKKKGDVLKVRIDTINNEERKISLGPDADDDSANWTEFKGANQQKLGSFGDLFAKASQVKSKR